MTFQYLELRHDAAIAAVTINRPEVRNALSQDVLSEIEACFTTLAARDDLIAVTLRGSGERCFAAGGDLHQIEMNCTAAVAEKMARDSSAALDAVRRCPVPVYALLNGDAIGGGAELAMACDVRLASAHMRFGYAQATLNIAPAWGGGSDLIRTLGAARALELMASGRLLNAEQAQALGLVQGVNPPEQIFEDYCAAYFGELAARRPQVMRALKALSLAHREGLAPDAVRAVEIEHLCQTWCHDDHWLAHAAVLQRISRRS